eukprot:symbB.v1.2.014350.t1/scaffold1047.1/size141927/16
MILSSASSNVRWPVGTQLEPPGTQLKVFRHSGGVASQHQLSPVPVKATRALPLLVGLVSLGGIGKRRTLRRSAVARSALKPGSSPVSQIRNFSIIAHIDHGKSTLADRLLEMTGTVAKEDMKSQLLDSMDIERERGITIKLNTARMAVNEGGQDYVLNLIDTPGHVDFTYEVSRSLAACEGALLVVDATQGVQAQTIANEIVPVLNKVDLPSADPERVCQEIEEVVGIDCSNALFCSAKTGQGVPEIIKSIIEYVPAPKIEEGHERMRLLVFDSFYDNYRGVIAMFRVDKRSDLKLQEKSLLSRKLVSWWQVHGSQWRSLALVKLDMCVPTSRV